MVVKLGEARFEGDPGDVIQDEAVDVDGSGGSVDL